MEVIKIFKNKRKSKKNSYAESVQTVNKSQPFDTLKNYFPAQSVENRLYDQLREAVPVIDAAIDKILRLVGNFEIHCSDKGIENDLNYFLETIHVNAGDCGIHAFLTQHLNQLLTYGNAVGEIVMSNGQITALYNANLEDIKISEKTPLKIEILVKSRNGYIPLKYPDLILTSVLNPHSGSVTGTSILRGLPFVSKILIQIFNTIGVNWERIGNIRFAVSCDSCDSGPFAEEKANQIAEEWQRAMQSEETTDFVSVGNVKIQTIGADNQILQSDVPVRQMLEQIVAKLGIPPFLLGLNWSSTERMSSQQADILTSEIDEYRRKLNPIIRRICELWLTLNGTPDKVTIDWNDITLQDATELAKADYTRAQTRLTEQQIEKLRKENKIA